MTAKQRLDREARDGREVRRDTPAAVSEPKIDEGFAEGDNSSIEFEDRSGKAYHAAVVEVIAALEWVHQQRAAGQLPN